MTAKKIIIRLLASGMALLAMGAGLNWALAAVWNPPTANPPANNTSEPLNISPTTQTLSDSKTIDLPESIDWLIINKNFNVAGTAAFDGSVCLGADCRTSWPSGGISQWTTSGNDIYYNSGNVGIGTTTPDAILTVAGSPFILGGSGDANGNGGLDYTGDQLTIAQYLAGRRLLSVKQYAAADINGDGRVNMLDIDLISEIRFGRLTIDQAHYSMGKYYSDSAISIKYGGNVGISTTNPQARLDLGQLPAATEGLRIKIGTTTPYSPLAIVKADNTDAFRVKEDGNVSILGLLGIGTASPGNALDVQFSGNNTVAKFINTDAGKGWGIYVKAGGSDLDNNYYIALFKDAANNDRFKILANGNVIVNNLAGTGNRCVYVTNTGVLSAKTEDCGTGGDNLGNHTATQNIKLGSYWLSGDGGDEGIRVDASGNVGIGTTNPGSKLSINGAGSINALGTYYDMISFGIRGVINHSGNGNGILNAGGLQIAAQGTNNSTSGSGDINFFVTSSDSAGAFTDASYSQAMKIKYDGNVGIGTTNPQGDLAVARANTSYFQGMASFGTLWNGSSYSFKQLTIASQNIIYGAARSNSSAGNLLKLEICADGASPSCSTQLTVDRSGHVSFGPLAPTYNTGLYLNLNMSGQFGAAYAMRTQGTLSASANSTSLYALNLSGLSFSSGGYSGVNVYGLHLTGSTWGGGTVANAYAVYVNAPTKGTLSNWAIYSASGNNYFGGGVTVGGSITLGGVARSSWGIGTLTGSKWCLANSGATAIDCTANAPAGDNLGNHTAAQNLNMSSKNITNLANPVNTQDAATKNYIDTQLGGSNMKAILFNDVGVILKEGASRSVSCVVAGFLVNGNTVIQGGIIKTQVSGEGTCTGGWVTGTTASCTGSNQYGWYTVTAKVDSGGLFLKGLFYSDPPYTCYASTGWLTGPVGQW